MTAIPVFVIAGQSNGIRMYDDFYRRLVEHYGIDGFVMVHAAVGASALTRPMNDHLDWYTKTELPTLLLDRTLVALNKGPERYLHSVIWVHGEADLLVGWQTKPEEYAERLGDIRTRSGLIYEFEDSLRQAGVDIDADPPRWVISQFSNRDGLNWRKPTADARSEIRKQHAEVAKADQSVLIVDPDEVFAGTRLGVQDMFADTAHYSTNFQAVLSRALITKAINSAPGARDGLEIKGSDAAESLTGAAGDDIIRAGNGDDQAAGLAGNDILIGAEGRDTLRGGTGRDVLRGNKGNDELRGGKGHDLLAGGGNNDILRGSSGNDVLKGRKGKDTLSGNRGDDTLNGGAGADILKAFRGADILSGGAGADTFILRARASDEVVTIQDYEYDRDEIVLARLGRDLELDDIGIERDSPSTFLVQASNNDLAITVKVVFTTFVLRPDWGDVFVF